MKAKTKKLIKETNEDFKVLIILMIHVFIIIGIVIGIGVLTIDVSGWFVLLIFPIIWYLIFLDNKCSLGRFNL